jgi:hypothetical protein
MSKEQRCKQIHIRAAIAAMRQSCCWLVALLGLSIATVSAQPKPNWQPMMNGADAVKFSYPNSSAPAGSCSSCDPEQTWGVSAIGEITWPGSLCPDPNDFVNPTAFFCRSSLLMSGGSTPAPGPALWWTSLNSDGSQAQNISGGVLSRATSVTYRNTNRVPMTGFQVLANIASGGAGTKNIFFNETETYGGGPEYGFVYDSANVDTPFYFYWATNANCGGNPESCASVYNAQLKEYQCLNSPQDVYENAYEDELGKVHQIGGSSHSIPLPGAWDQELLYSAYLRRDARGNVRFHVEVDYPTGEVFRGLSFDIDPNQMGFGHWFPSEELYSNNWPGYLTITVLPALPVPSGVALTVHQIFYTSPGM